MRKNALIAGALVVATTGCHGGVTHRRIAPWFRIETTKPFVLAPHAVAWGAEEDAEALIDGAWAHLLDATDLMAYNVGNRMVVLRADQKGPWHIYRPGERTSVSIPHAWCPDIVGDHQRGHLVCLGCGRSPPRKALASGCSSEDAQHLAAFAVDALGRVQWSLTTSTDDVDMGHGWAVTVTSSGAPVLSVSPKNPANADACYVLSSHGLEATEHAHCAIERGWRMSDIEQ